MSSAPDFWGFGRSLRAEPKASAKPSSHAFARQVRTF